MLYYAWQHYLCAVLLIGHQFETWRQAVQRPLSSLRREKTSFYRKLAARRYRNRRKTGSILQIWFLIIAPRNSCREACIYSRNTRKRSTKQKMADKGKICRPGSLALLSDISNVQQGNELPVFSPMTELAMIFQENCNR